MLYEVPEGTIRTRLRRARLALEQAFERANVAAELATGGGSFETWAARLRARNSGADEGR